AKSRRRTSPPALTSSTSPWRDSPWRHLGVSDSEDMPGEEGQHHLGDVDGSRHLWRCSSCSRSLADGRRKPPPDCLHGGRWWSMVFTYLTTRLGSADRRL
uniref:Uncharacterized protein n=1 Tax=Aegilops tauschii subsp. strangulata TaxID=200361 RepID=A0A453EC10_AEGTS